MKEKMETQMTERQKQALDTQKRICSSALKLFTQKGYENVSMREIAKEAGCSVGNIYHYFRNKDALILHFTDHVDEVYAQIAKDMKGDPRPARERLQDFMIRAIVLSNREDVIAMGFSHALHYPELRSLDINGERPYFQFLSALIEEAKAQGDIAPHHQTQDILRRFLILQRGILFQWRVEQGRFDVAPLSDTMVTAMLNSLK